MSIYDIEQHGAVTSIRLNFSTRKNLWFLLMADNHFDSLFCNRDLMTSHFELAKKRNAHIMIFGDWFDAMQGRFDPRRCMGELRPEYKRDDYYDFVVKDSRDYLLPYASLIDIIADGNHELSVLKAANTNLIDRLIFALHDKTESKIMHGGYGGWVRLMFTLAVKGDGTRISKKIKYYHGSGGDAPVTRGAIQTNRQAVYLPDANLVVNGHSHNQYYIPISRERISSQGKLHFDLQHHIRIPGYKQSYGDGTTGWDVTRGSPPKPIGAVWIKLYCENRDVKIQVIPDITGGEPVSLSDKDLYSGIVYAEDREGE